MRRGGGAFIALVLGIAAVAPLCAQENNDVDLIPQSIQNRAPQPSAAEVAAPAVPPGAHGKYYVEDALTGSSLRSDLVVPLPAPAPSDWENRTSIDIADQWNLGARLTATLSDRFNLTEENDVGVASGHVVRNDFREGYVTWEALTRSYLEAGRINLRNGIALGFNPTDFFKTRTLLDQASLDPSVVREDRLGTLMLRAQSIWAGGSASVALAPKLYAPTPLALGIPYGLGAKLDHTNADNRMLGSINFDLADLSPQLLVYRQAAQTLFGSNLSHPIGQSIVAYAEWAGGRQQSLIVQALDYGIQTATLPPDIRVLPASEPGETFRSDVAVGASWTGVQKITLNLEYHYHQAGLSGQNVRDWFQAGSAQRNELPVTGELWYIRGFASDQQQPWVRQQLFLRADWIDALIPHLEISGFAFIDLYDASSLTQLSANYYLSDAWTVGAYVSANLGDARSERGSAPQAASLIVRVLRYF